MDVGITQLCFGSPSLVSHGVLRAVELFLYWEFNINYKAKHISFDFSTKVVQNMPPIRIDSVINEYTTEVSQEEQSDYLGVKKPGIR